MCIRDRDYAAIGAAYGCKTYTVKTLDELKAAIEDAKKLSLIHIWMTAR